MRLKKRLFSAFFITTAVATLYSCGGEESTSSTTVKTYQLTPVERVYCDSLHIDSALIISLRSKTKAKLNVFLPAPHWVYGEDGSVMEVPSKLEALYFEADQSNAKVIVDELRADFQKKGHTIYVCEENFGNGNDKVAIVNTADKYSILKETGTDGANYDIDNDSLQKIIHTFDEKYDLTLVGCNYDWCEFAIGKEPMNWKTLADECYAVCPDIVDQGTGTVDALADELKRTKTIYFWWD